MSKVIELIGQDYHLEFDGKDYYVDFLFYHTQLKRYIVVQIESRKFDPRDVGSLNFYLAVIDTMLCTPHDKPTAGLLLCTTKDTVTVEYALRSISSPIIVAWYENKNHQRGLIINDLYKKSSSC